VVRPEVVRRRLEQLAEYLTILERYQRYDLEELKKVFAGFL